MTLPLTLIENLDDDPHHYRTLCPDDEANLLEVVAAEYVRLRTECEVPILDDIVLDGIEVVSMDELHARLKQATIPPLRQGNFGVLRSDFGETLSYLCLEHYYQTKLGYKSVRDRETVQLPGRGIDAVGVEDTDPLTLVLGETKVSDESVSPPQVVDRASDGLRNQHRKHLEEIKNTSDKIWDLSRRTRDQSLRDLLLKAALLFERELWDKLHVVAYCVLVRPRTLYTADDFGSFLKKHGDYTPAQIRFWIICVPERIDAWIMKWDAAIKKSEAVE